MYYFTLEDGEMKLNAVEKLPAEIEAIYWEARQAYTIDYQLSDWADDDGDSGMGYCYDNSYGMRREPFRREMVIKDGVLAGFYVGRIPAYMTKEGSVLSPEDKKAHFLELHDGKEIFDDRQPYSKRYSYSECWKVMEEKERKLCEYVFLLLVEQTDRDYRFTAADFSEELVEEVVKQIYIEDSSGHFNEAFRVKLKLKPVASKQPDRVLEELSKYRAFLVRE